MLKDLNVICVILLLKDYEVWLKNLLEVGGGEVAHRFPSDHIPGDYLVLQCFAISNVVRDVSHLHTAAGFV